MAFSTMLLNSLSVVLLKYYFGRELKSVGKPGTAETVKECDTHYRKQDKVETRFGKSCQKTENGKKHRLFHRDFLLIDAFC